VDIVGLLATERETLERDLDEWLPAEGEYPTLIHEALRYSALGGGKRLRPILALAATRSLGLDPDLVIRSACAIEYVHCCSLVLDDLPSMDDASLRRGRPTVHKAFGVATAILAVDALLMHAFRLVADNGEAIGASGPCVAAAVRNLAMAVGSYGMVGGQHVDLEASSKGKSDPGIVEYIQTRKTGSLFVVAATTGGTLLGAEQSRIDCVGQYARNLGLAYQIIDDILDVEGDEAVVGKDLHKDQDKLTFVALHGVDGARRMAREFVDEALLSLHCVGDDVQVLRGLAAYCLERVS